MSDSAPALDVGRPLKPVDELFIPHPWGAKSIEVSHIDIFTDEVSHSMCGKSPSQTMPRHPSLSTIRT